MIAVPGMLRACCGGVESGMIGLMRGINSSQQAYAIACAHGKYAADLKTLAVAPLRGGAAFIDPGAVTGLRDGYRVTLLAQGETFRADDTCNGSHMVAAGYFVEAHPVDTKSGRRSFATDDKGTVFSREDGTAIQPGMDGARPIE
jgi:hypothetical protein